VISALSRTCGSTAVADAGGEEYACDVARGGWDAKALADLRRTCRASRGGANARRPRRTADVVPKHVDIVQAFFHGNSLDTYLY